MIKFIEHGLFGFLGLMILFIVSALFHIVGRLVRKDSFGLLKNVKTWWIVLMDWFIGMVIIAMFIVFLGFLGWITLFFFNFIG